MCHVLILGMTESGKTTLAKKLSARFQKQGVKVIVLDPLNDPGWFSDYSTDKQDLFLETFWASKSCAVFIDESGDMVGKYDTTMQQTATKGRHWGHRVHYISQRGAMLARTVRDQCSHLFIFNTALEDCKIHAREWNKPELLEASKLEQGGYYHVTRFGAVSRSNIFEE